MRNQQFTQSLLERAYLRGYLYQTGIDPGQIPEAGKEAILDNFRRDIDSDMGSLVVAWELATHVPTPSTGAPLKLTTAWPGKCERIESLRRWNWLAKIMPWLR